MIRLFSILILLSISLAAQTTVKAIPQKHSVVTIHNATVNGAAVTTTAIDPSQWAGVMTLFMEMDTTDAGTPGTAGLKPQYYNANSATWYDYLDLGDMVTIAAANWANKKFIVNLAIYDDHAWGDSTRWVFTPAAGDTGTVRIDIGGQ